MSLTSLPCTNTRERYPKMLPKIRGRKRNFVLCLFLKIYKRNYIDFWGFLKWLASFWIVGNAGELIVIYFFLSKLHFPALRNICGFFLQCVKLDLPLCRFNFIKWFLILKKLFFRYYQLNILQLYFNFHII